MRNWGSSAMMWILINTTRPRGVEGTGGPGCGARGRQRGLAGLRGDAQSHTSAHQAPQVWRAPEGLAAVPVGGSGAWPDNEPTRRATRQHTRPHRCGGRRRDRGHGRVSRRGAWPRCRWAVAGPGRASRSTAPSRRLACGDLAGGPPPTGTHSGPAHQGKPRGARNTRGATSNKQQATHTKTPTRNRVGVSEPPVGIEPTTYSLRVNRSAD